MNQTLLECIDKSSHDTRKFTTPKLLNLPIPVPSIDDQRKLVADADKLIKTRHFADGLAAECTKAIEALMPSMLNRAFSN